MKTGNGKWHSLRRRVLGVACAFLALVGLSTLIPDLWYSGRRDAYDAVDLDHLLDCAIRANSCYHEPQTIRNEFGSHVEVVDFPRSGMRALIDRNPDGEGPQWVVFRGTANLSNCFADLDFIEREDHELGIRVHRGFDEALQECLPWVTAELERDRPTCVTGHSLGGSVAILLSAILDRRGYQEVSAVTFGQPMVTDSHGAELLGQFDILRVVFDDDPVPLVPPASVAVDHLDIYHHCGVEIMLREDGHFYYTEAHDPERLSVADFWSNLTHIHPKSHILGNSYLPALRLAKERAQRTDR